ncbi:uncharacterized protein LOC143360950 isoform X2 [Halictus rubicundus]|uniref:uncharacterized protein LOC143360950 isoform X2 n=1 Tax=Halictus rubicundus TaxID=77578 RepID=UPI00403672CC
MEPTRVPRAPDPRLVFLVGTLALTFAATGLLCGAIMSDHWEEINWNKAALTRANVTLTWYLDGQVAMLENGHRNHRPGRRPTFLVPMYGGIWIMCVSLTGMQNLSISCSLVCLIILGTAVLIGFFGLCRHQLSAVLVTGVMYLLAATFALFTLTIIHFKRAQDREARILDGPEDGVIGGPVPRNVLKARRFSSSWSMDFGWGGVTLCALASVAWILLSKIMRFSPVAAMIA